MVIHLGEPGYRAACGQLWPHQVTVNYGLVTCQQCRGTLRFRTRWYG